MAKQEVCKDPLRQCPFTDEMHELIIRIDERLSDTLKDVREIKYTINGNGVPGIKREIERNTAFRKAFIWCISILISGVGVGIGVIKLFL